MEGPAGNLPPVFYQNLAQPQQQTQDQRTQLGYPNTQQSQYGQFQNRSPGPAPGGYSNSAQRPTALVPVQTHESTDSLQPIPRAAKAMNDAIAFDERYADFDTMIGQVGGMSYDCKNAPEAWAPFARTASYQIPEKILRFYNMSEVIIRMGLFAEIGRAWITVDNNLFIWNFAGGDDIADFDAQPYNILTVKLAKPRPGVFIEAITHILLVATTNELTVYGVSATKNGRPGNGHDLKLYATGITVPTKGINVNNIEASAKTGRIFFSGSADNDVYELVYQDKEKWFQPRASKVCHTQNSYLSSFAPKIPFFSETPSTEKCVQMVIDDTRDILYTLSSTSTIRLFHLKGLTECNLSITYPLRSTLDYVKGQIGTVPVLAHGAELVSISAISSQEATRAHLVAVSDTGCRLYYSAVYHDSYSSGAPTSLQCTHVRLPPDVEGSYMPEYSVEQFRTPAKISTWLTSTRTAAVFAPGYFLAFTNTKKGAKNENDCLFLVAPDTAKISLTTASRPLGLVESGQWVQLEGRVEAVELMTAPFAASKRPTGFGNESAVQFDQASTEIAVLTNDGIHLFRRKRYVEILTSVIKNGAANGTADAEVRYFFTNYGREEGCCNTLAIACGVLNDSRSGGRATDIDLTALARKYFLEFSGKAVVIEQFGPTATLPSLDDVKVSGHHEGIATYMARIIRSLWKLPFVTAVQHPTGVATFQNSTTLAKLHVVQDQLMRLKSFLDDTRPYIDGLNGKDSMVRAKSKIDEVSQMAEHRALHSDFQMLEAMIEGISFAIVLFEDKLDDVMNSLSDENRRRVLNMTYEILFATEGGREMARELVTAIVNRSIQAGSSVDNITDSLRRRCGSFCTSQDIVSFKALECLKRARTMLDPNSKDKLLGESERLYEQVAAVLSKKEIDDAVKDLAQMRFYAGAIRLALTCAEAKDPGKLAAGYINANLPRDDVRAKAYDERMDCYELVWLILTEVEKAVALEASPASTFGDRTPSSLRDEAYNVVDQATDEIFLTCYYDWLFQRGDTKRLMELESPAIIGYLELKASSSLPHADLLWQYFQKRESFYQAAKVQRELAVSQFPIGIDKRIEYLSRARGLSNCYCPIDQRQAMNDLLQLIEEEQDVAMVQIDILTRVKGDVRISQTKLRQLTDILDGPILPMSDLYNRYAEPYEYYEVCLSIFQSADYRGNGEIRKMWQGLLKQTHEQPGNAPPYVAVADVFRSLGKRFHLSEYIFPADDLMPMLLQYQIEHQPESPLGWVSQTFIDAGVNFELLVRILDEMFYRDEAPFKGVGRKRLVLEAIGVIAQWLTSANKGHGRSTALGMSLDRDGYFKKDMVIRKLNAYISNEPRIKSDGALTQKIGAVIREVEKH